MTYDSRSRPSEPPEMANQQNDSFTTPIESNDISPERLKELFPEGKLRALINKISSPRWVVPVLPEQELECLLNYAIELTKAGVDEECELCMCFYRDGLTVSFMKILTDEAVNSWKYNIHFCILNSCGKLLQLCALHMKRDNPYLLDLLAIVLDPDNKFNTFNLSRPSIQYTYASDVAAATVALSGATPTTTTLPSSAMIGGLSTSTSIQSGLYTIGTSGSSVNGQPAASQSPNATTVDSSHWGTLDDSKIFAKTPSDPMTSRGWLVDLINRFGQFGGFENLFERFQSGIALLKAQKDQQNTAKAGGGDGGSGDDGDTARNTKSRSASLTGGNATTPGDENRVTLHLIYALIRPFGQCYELLTVATIEKYFMPMWEVTLELLDNLSDDELKREAKPEGRSDSINGIVKAARCLASRLNNQDSLIKELEMFRLKMILRLLKISSFNGKMNALNEINKMLSAVSYYPHRSAQGPMCQPEDEMEWLSAERIAAWIKDSDVLGIVLRDSLHQPQYVEKLEKILRFLIKEKSLTLTDLDAVWQAQAGKHEAIVKNVHDLLAKLAWDFNTEQLDYLFDCFQASMTTANKRQRERLLELIRRLAEDDKSGVMAHKVLKLFWTLAHNVEVPQEVMDQALTAHVKILDYSCAQERDAQKSEWLTRCVEELKADSDWVLPALRLIREICCLYEPSTSLVSRVHQNLNRQNVIDRLQNDHTLVILVTNSLTSYLDRVHAQFKLNPDLLPENIITDGRFPHQQQLQERLDFLKFVLKDGQLWLCSDQAKQIWHCLAVNAVFPSDRDDCFRWFGKLMGEEPDLDPGINKDFFENNILQLDPQLLSESGIKCFERFFKAVNSKEEKLKAKSRGYILDDEDLIGKDYLWRVITTGNEQIAQKAIELLKEVSTALGPRLQANIADFHDNFIMECCDRLKAYHDNITVLTETIDGAINENSQDCKDVKMRHIEAEKMCRVISVLQEYIKECDRSFVGERLHLPLSRANRGRHITLYVRFQSPGRQQIEDMECNTHTNEMVVSFKRNLLKRIKGMSMNNIKVDFYYTNDSPIEISDDRNPIGIYTIRDKMVLTAKLTPTGPGLSSSPDSSSDSSTGSPPRPCPDMQKPETEWQLPGIIISQKPKYIEFFLRLYQLGIDLNHAYLRDSCRTFLQLLPIDRQTVQKLQHMYDTRTPSINPEAMFLHAPPAQVLYNLEVLYALLVPAIEGNQPFQLSWIHSGVAHFILELLTKNNFLPNADTHTKRAAFHNVLRLVKLFLYVVGCTIIKVGQEPPIGCHESGRSQIDILKQTFTQILGGTEQTIRMVAIKLADNLATEMLSCGMEGDACRKLFATALKWSCPDIPTIKAIVSLAWASGCGSLDQLGVCNDFSDEAPTPEQHDHNLCKEAFEVLTIALVLNPAAHEALNHDPIWPKFIISLVLTNPLRQIRTSAAEQLFLCSTYCAPDHRSFAFIVNLLMNALDNEVQIHAASCVEYFHLLCRSLSYGTSFNWPLSINTNTLLTKEIAWLRSVRQNVKDTGESKVHEDLLEGHLTLTKELLLYLNPDLKGKLMDFLEEIIDDFLFPASRQYLQLRRTNQLTNSNAPPPVCRSPHTITAACDLLTALCQNSIPNMKLIVNNVLEMFCSDTEPLREWEYLPPVGSRPFKGFCGLKNAGATCYMNSVLQQLFMVPMIRLGILNAPGACNDPIEDFSNDSEGTSDLYSMDDNSGINNRNRYHIGILKHVQSIFAHLGHSALQFYVPRGLWSHFKLQGEPVNLREQQDAVEFFMSILDSLDEGLKALGQPQLMASTLGGCFSDQKICQECPHRYSKEEPFSVFSVDIRNHSSLTESLEQYVKGELLEGADAYHCDKCNKKVVTVKRLCVRKLPPILAIQLKRFEYDYERVCAIKFNDYFEFPRELDMEPYTVSGLAKIENEVIEVDEHPDEQGAITTKYELTGIVVHSGQASGGHYFSYILHKDPTTGKEQWYKFDDGEVTECKMHEDEEMKAQCFGGDYMGEVFDNNLKRMQFRRQKRWWNAYMLFYTRCDQHLPKPAKATVEQLSLAESRNCVLPMPVPIERSVRAQNIRFLHSRSLFTTEFFNFIRKLVGSCAPPPRLEKLTPQMEELSLLGIQLASQFLFHSGFRTKKTIRGTAIDWYETLHQHIRHSPLVRRWFAEHTLLDPSTRLGEYILAAPSPELRNMFVKLIVMFCHFSIPDEPIELAFRGDNLCEQILLCALHLLKSEVPEHGKHLTQYFTLFYMYATLGMQQKNQLLKLNVPAIFMQVALDEGPGPPIKHQYPELCKLHQVVSQLVRCSNITTHCHSADDGKAILPNIYGDGGSDTLMPLSKEASEYLFAKNTYIKKLIEDIHVGEEGLKLLQYCSWENPHFSRFVLTELLWQCGFAYWHDMRHHTEMLLNILLMEDSWQNHRIHNALLGVAEEREGLLDTIQRTKAHYQKRAYQIMKCLVELFKRSRIAHNLLHSNMQVAHQWHMACDWLRDEMDRRVMNSNQYSYSSWSPTTTPAMMGTTNENTNGYMLERSASAKNVLQLAYELLPVEEDEQQPADDSDMDCDDKPESILSRHSQSQDHLEHTGETVAENTSSLPRTKPSGSMAKPTDGDHVDDDDDRTEGITFTAPVSKAPMVPETIQNTTTTMQGLTIKSDGNSKSIFIQPGPVTIGGSQPISTSPTSPTAVPVTDKGTVRPGKISMDIALRLFRKPHERKPDEKASPSEDVIDDSVLSSTSSSVQSDGTSTGTSPTTTTSTTPTIVHATPKEQQLT